ncbi:MAG: sulfotransferase family 2 domain-containing protein [Bryobacteraceae bacterium]|nr:sulfotransferase family 2 domain-containing protein [Bryobacteraceae bacterium]
MFCSLRGLILQFAHYRSIDELDEITKHLDEDLRHPVGVYLIALARLPESLDTSCENPGYSGSEHLRQVLLCEEFQMAIVRNLLHSFPEFRRLLFVHVPKCAGADLSVMLSRRFFLLQKPLTVSDWTSKSALFEHLRGFAANLSSLAREILVCGHFTLSEYITANLIRAEDSLFTVVRDPVERIISHVNYVMTVMKLDLAMTRPDTKAWASSLQLPNLEQLTFDEELATLILINSAFAGELQNRMCRMLGSDDGTFASAAQSIKQSNIEVVLLENYESWLASKWGLESEGMNPSEKFISYERLSSKLRAFIVDELAGEDLKLYEFARLEQKSLSSTANPKGARTSAQA